MKIYNSLTRKKEEFEPKGKVTMYICGITAYDVCHLGHLRSAIVFDVIRNYFRYKGYKVKFVKNITDVDDKIIDKARKLINDGTQKDLKEAAKTVTEKYIKEYYEDMQKFHIEKADVEPRATEHIQDMINLIGVLIKKGHAYVVGSDVYFDVLSFPEYGKLSNQDIKQLKHSAKTEAGEKKRNAIDFALWKSAKEDEPSWDSPWGKGRPGWHIECSAMSSKYLGESFDIHGGGIDLIFPHHENERAQSEAAFGQFANIWMHNGLLTINGEKMAKSAGNYVTIEDALKKYPPVLIKIFMIGAHYRHPLDFTEDDMKEAAAKLQRLKYFFYNVERIIESRKEYLKIVKQQIKRDAKEFKQKIDQYKVKFIEAMDDDFNTAAALGVLFEIVNVCNSHMQSLSNIEIDGFKYAKETVIALSSVLGLSLEKEIEEIDSKLMPHIRAKIKERDKARKAKDFKKADEIRDELLKEDIVLEDTEQGTIPRRRW